VPIPAQFANQHMATKPPYMSYGLVSRSSSRKQIVHVNNSPGSEHMIPTDLSPLDLISRARRISAVSGVVLLLALTFASAEGWGDRLALVALTAVGLATALAWVQLLLARPIDRLKSSRPAKQTPKPWLFAAIGVAAVSGVAVQSWFRPGTTIATGDISPPQATAWVARLFEPWIWSGSNLGGPSELPLQLPWAAVLGVVHVLGGDPELAQRIWYTTLFVGAGLCALGLLAALRLGPIAAMVGAVVYLLNPYVVSVVGINAVYIAALGLLTGIPAIVLAAGNGQLSVRWAVVLIVLTAPIIGFVDSNPPLVGMVLGALLAAPLLAGWVDGRAAAVRSLRTVVFAALLLVAASAYWVVPTILHLGVVSSHQLSTVSSWSWTEGRATILNAFWLNSIWAWTYPEYYPYAAAYDSLPLSAVRFILPAIAFGALSLGQFARYAEGHFKRARQLRLTVAAATVAIAVVFLSTGTNAPGNLVFDRLYHLPLGWLLREPGRFLMVVALAYAALVAVAVESLLDRGLTIDFAKLGRRSTRVLGFSVVPVALGTSLLVGFPLYTGAVVPDTRVELPSAHVQVPSYWTEMAHYIDGLSTQGALLVMPPDDFYQMPYTWPYYGTDDFVVDMFHRQVLMPNPNGQAYAPASPQVLAAVNLTAQSILNKDWGQTEALVTALNTPLILVRGDIDSSYRGRVIDIYTGQVTSTGRVIPNPKSYFDKLAAAPNFVLIRQIGSLYLFALRDTGSGSRLDVSNNFVTINTETPDLRLLSLLPPGTSLVSSQPQAGVPNVFQAPPSAMWRNTGDGLVWQISTPPDRSYRLADLESKTVLSLDSEGSFTFGSSRALVAYSKNASSSVTVSVTGPDIISNGDFTRGSESWKGDESRHLPSTNVPPVLQPLDCNTNLTAIGTPDLKAEVIADAAPGRLPALQLLASAGSSCVYQDLVQWHGGPLVLSVMVHSVQGSPPRMCIQEDFVAQQQCASLPNIPHTTGWSLYRASVSPDPGTKSLSLFLYADGDVKGVRTIIEYANVRVGELSAPPSFALLADPTAQPASSPQLVVARSSFSSDWQGPAGAKHVLVDGLLNGWLMPPGMAPFNPTYAPTAVLRTAQSISLVAVLIALVLPLRSSIGRMITHFRARSRP
jgi:hypothetical protein